MCFGGGTATLSSIGLFSFEFSSKVLNRNFSLKKYRVAASSGKWLDMATQVHILRSTISWRKAAPLLQGRSMTDPLPHSLQLPIKFPPLTSVSWFSAWSLLAL